jgi:NADH-quinone oxidoreductase subunit N
MVLNSAIAAFYYLKLIVYMFLKTREDQVAIEYQDMTNTIILKVIIGMSVVLSLSAIFWIDTLLYIIGMAVEISGY